MVFILVIMNTKTGLSCKCFFLSILSQTYLEAIHMKFTFIHTKKENKKKTAEFTFKTSKK